MSTKYSNTDRSDDDRIYPAEKAYGPRNNTPAWRRITPDLSGGYVEVHLALHCGHPDYIDEVTSS